MPLLLQKAQHNPGWMNIAWKQISPQVLHILAIWKWLIYGIRTNRRLFPLSFPHPILSPLPFTIISSLRDCCFLNLLRLRRSHIIITSQFIIPSNSEGVAYTHNHLAYYTPSGFCFPFFAFLQSYHPFGIITSFSLTHPKSFHPFGILVFIPLLFFIIISSLRDSSFDPFTFLQ